MDPISSLLKSIETGDRSFLDSAIEEIESKYGEMVSENPSFDFKKEMDFHEELSAMYIWIRYPSRRGEILNAEKILRSFTKRGWKDTAIRVAAHELYDRLVEINARHGDIGGEE